jgi:hypothetical protein
MHANHESHRDWSRTATVLRTVLLAASLVAGAIALLSITGVVRVPAGVLLALGVSVALLFVGRMFAAAHLQLDDEDTDR